SDRADGDKKKDRIKQCRQNRRAAESVSFSLCWQTLGHRARAPSEQEAKHVGEVVTRVCDQRQRMSEKSENRLEDNISGVQRNAYCEGSIQTRRRMRMVGVRMRVFVSHDVRQVVKSSVVNGGFGKGCGIGRDLRSKTLYRVGKIKR